MIESLARLPSNPKSFERQADRLVTTLLLRQTTFTTDFSGQLQGPATGRLTEGPRTLMQQDAQRFTSDLVKLRLDGFWSRRLLHLTSNAFCHPKSVGQGLNLESFVS